MKRYHLDLVLAFATLAIDGCGRAARPPVDPAAQKAAAERASAKAFLAECLPSSFDGAEGKPSGSGISYATPYVEREYPLANGFAMRVLIIDHEKPLADGEGWLANQARSPSRAEYKGHPAIFASFSRMRKTQLMVARRYFVEVTAGSRSRRDAQPPTEADVRRFLDALDLARLAAR